MTRVAYFDPVSDRVIEDDVSAASLAALLARVERLTSERGIPAIEVLQHGASLSLGTDGVRACLVWVDSSGASFHSLGGGENAPVLVYDYMGSWTEAPGEWTVPKADAVSCMKSFLESGTPGAAVVFEAE